MKTNASNGKSMENQRKIDDSTGKSPIDDCSIAAVVHCPSLRLQT